MQQDIILRFIKNNRNEMKKSDLLSFATSSEFNNIDNEESKRILFYFQSFINSSKKYTKLNSIVNELDLIFETINSNKSYQNIHGSYQVTICNYLEQIIYLIKNTDTIYDTNFVYDLTDFIEIITKIYYNHSDEIVEVVKYLKNIEIILQYNKNKINKENIINYEKCQQILNKVIEKLENKNNDSLKSNNYYTGCKNTQNNITLKSSFSIFNNDSSKKNKTSNNFDSIYSTNIKSNSNSFKTLKYNGI